jgi:hypothetical protein
VGRARPLASAPRSANQLKEESRYAMVHQSMKMPPDSSSIKYEMEGGEKNFIDRQSKTKYNLPEQSPSKYKTSPKTR